MDSQTGVYDPTRGVFKPGPGQYHPLKSNRPNSEKYSIRAKSYPKGKE